MRFIFQRIKSFKTMKKLSLEEIRVVEGGFCDTFEYWEALAGALNGRNHYT